MATSAENAAQIFTQPLDGNVAFVISSDNGVKAASFKCVSGSISIKGNVQILKIQDADGNELPHLTSAPIVLTSTTIPELNISTIGSNSALQLTVDASAGVGAMILEL